MLPDGSCSSITLRPGASIREVLQDLCQSISINIAAVDLFLVGGEKVREADAADKLVRHWELWLIQEEAEKNAAIPSSINWLKLLFITNHTLVNAAWLHII